MGLRGASSHRGRRTDRREDRVCVAFVVASVDWPSMRWTAMSDQLSVALEGWPAWMRAWLSAGADAKRNIQIQGGDPRWKYS